MVVDAAALCIKVPGRGERSYTTVGLGSMMRLCGCISNDDDVLSVGAWLGEVGGSNPCMGGELL